jgi:hypothetical protein
MNERDNHHPFVVIWKSGVQSRRIMNTPNTVHAFRCSTECFVLKRKRKKKRYMYKQKRFNSDIWYSIILPCCDRQKRANITNTLRVKEQQWNNLRSNTEDDWQNYFW